MSETSQPELPPPLQPSSPTPPPAARARRFTFGEAWPFYAAALLVAGTLLVVFLLLHPRRGGDAGADAGTPATVTVEEVALQREASPRGAAIATLVRGKRVRVRAEADRWVAAEADGATGFLPAE
ncbi:MAG TPA: hypothetical protein VGG65_03495, partial [Thermoanaerobaculia bacterium]